MLTALAYSALAASAVSAPCGCAAAGARERAKPGGNGGSELATADRHGDSVAEYK